jgi:hypothetical protein
LHTTPIPFQLLDRIAQSGEGADVGSGLSTPNAVTKQHERSGSGKIPGMLASLGCTEETDQDVPQWFVSSNLPEGFREVTDTGPGNVDRSWDGAADNPSGFPRIHYQNTPIPCRGPFEIVKEFQFTYGLHPRQDLHGLNAEGWAVA